MTNDEAIVFGKRIANFGWLNNDTQEFIELAVKALEQDPCEDADIKLIHTQGLDDGIRCAMCTNSMANDKGCDGGCVVNEVMYKKILDVIRRHIIDGG